MKLRLRPYQEQGVAEIREQFGQGKKSVLYVLPTGGGKTVTYAHIAEQAGIRGNRVLILEHRKELIRQASLAAGGLGVYHSIVAPDNKVAEIRRSQVERLGQPMIRNNTNVAVASVQTLARRLSWLQEFNPALIIIDECFPAGTMIDGRPIEKIEPGEKVRSFNHSTSEVECRTVMGVMHRRNEGDWYRVTTECGSSFVCTENHPVFTVEFGYLPAKSLPPHGRLRIITNHEMPELQQRNAQTNPVGEPPVQILRHKMSQSACELAGLAEGAARTLVRSLRAARLLPQKKVTHGSLSAGGCLLLGRMQVGNSKGAEFRHHEEDEPKPPPRHINANENEQPYVRPGREKENVIFPSGQDIPVPGREREIHPASNGTAPSNRSGYRGSHTNSSGKRSFRKLAERILRGLGFNGNKAGCRGRWQEPQAEEVEVLGCQKDRDFRISRLASVEVYKRGSGNRPGWVPDDPEVYNIHVDGNHNYFANGVLVHNCHHTVAGTWRRIIDALPKARLLGVTATPCRTDGQGLGDVFEAMVLGPSPVDLIDMGNLVRPRIFAPPLRADLSSVHRSKGDYRADELASVLDQPTITGDAVDHYRRLAPGRPAIVFCVNVRHAHHVAATFRDAGFNFHVIHGGMDDGERDRLIYGLANGHVQGLVSVDVISEGTDIPVAEVAIMLRATESESLFLQQAGRVLRPAPNKEYGLIIDHVGNVLRHGRPEAEREWTLEGRKKRERQGEAAAPELRIMQCPECYIVHDPAGTCPNCGHVYEARAFQPRQVDGELQELHETEAERQAREEKQAQRRAQGRAQSVEQMVKQLGYSRARATKILEARQEKERLQGELRDLLIRWSKRTGRGVLQGWGFSMSDVRAMKPKALRESIDKVSEALFMDNANDNEAPVQRRLVGE